MTLYSLSGGGQHLNKEWHDKRQKARESLGLFEWGDIDIERYDLDDLQFDRKARSVKSEPRIESEGAAKAGHYLHRPGYLTD